MTNIKDEFQDRIVEQYLDLDVQRSTIVSPTGSGKSFIVMKILKRGNFTSPIILVNSEVLRDSNWEAEFKKFGMEEYYKNNVTLKTYQAAHKLERVEQGVHDIVIFDEVDFMARTKKYARTMNTYGASKILGVTGFIDESKLFWFKNNLPIIVHHTVREFQEKGLLNNIEFVFVKYELSVRKRIPMRKYGQEYTSENELYDQACKKLASLRTAEQVLYKQFYALSDSERISKKEAILADIDKATIKRNNILNSNNSSADVAKEIIAGIKRVNPDGKVVIFSNTTKQSEKISMNVYNGSQTKSENDKVYDNFISSKIKVLGVCGKINRGSNIPDLKYGIYETFDASSTKAHQRSGRLLRLDPQDMAQMFVLLPYYREQQADNSYLLKPTYMVSAAKHAFKSVHTSINKVSNKTFDGTKQSTYSIRGASNID